ncbi:MAG: DUF1893 domain-containing protein [Prevotellaceae bacterium]|jgi:hypothetical protein|nr:DUF1893 domain-containing protein [Prevotellaceae bacterium]
MEELKKILLEGGYSCVVANGKDVRTFTQRGVADVYDLLKNNPVFLRGASIADKVVGKGVASLMVLGEVKKLYANIISSPALSLLHKANIDVAFSKVVPFIQNRDLSDWCPLEKICYKEDSAVNILPLVNGFIKKIQLNS